MALIGLKQLDPILTGSLQVSGSAGVTGSIEVSGDISGSSTSTGSFGSGHFAGNVTLGDTDKIKFGVGTDLEIYSDGTNGRIDSDSMQIAGDSFDFVDSSALNYLMRVSASNAVSLYYAGNKKLETSISGINVTGHITASGDISGSSTSTGSFGALRTTGQALTVNNVGTVSGSSTSTGSFGYMNVSGDTVIGGNLTLGDADTDSVSFGEEI